VVAGHQVLQWGSGVVVVVAGSRVAIVVVVGCSIKGKKKLTCFFWVSILGAVGADMVGEVHGGCRSAWAVVVIGVMAVSLDIGESLFFGGGCGGISFSWISSSFLMHLFWLGALVVVAGRQVLQWGSGAVIVVVGWRGIGCGVLGAFIR
jgi:hypothetical protein